MEFDWRHALAAAAALFVAFLVFKMRPVRRRGRAFVAELAAARERVRRASSPEERVEALCEAGALAARGAGREAAAAGLFLRAMRAAPASPQVIERAAAALARSAPRVLEKMLWRRLSALPWEGAHRAAARAAALGLRDLYLHALRDRGRAGLMGKLADELAAPRR
ncbi:MAG: hypothetical protein IT372_14360 [Polyangiaceae bacterium]|nr:hypothetical protein [Polyangiaceae bacterium]